MKKGDQQYLIELDAGIQEKKNPEILRILLSERSVRVDFGYTAPWIYIRGGWIRIAPYTYLTVQGSNKKYKLLEAINIPVAPEKLDFESKEDWRVFTLLFEPIPIKNCVVDIIEEEKPRKNDFNFYNVKLNVNQKIEFLTI